MKLTATIFALALGLTAGCGQRSAGDPPPPAPTAVAPTPPRDGAKPTPARPGPQTDACLGEAASVLAATLAYKQLAASAPHLRTLPESDLRADRTCDLRVVVDDISGETRTLGRFRVDFAARQVLQYNPAEAGYAPLASTAELFKTGSPPPR